MVVADLLLAAAMPDQDRVLALALGNTVGMLILGVLLGWAVLFYHGGPALVGVGRTALLGVLAGGVSAGVGTALSDAFGQSSALAACDKCGHDNQAP